MRLSRASLRLSPSVAAAVAVGLAAAALLVSTAGDYGLTWDEPVYTEAVDRVAAWFREAFAGVGALTQALDDDHLQEAWVFGRSENRNLPVPILVSIAGHTFASRWLGPLASYRVGHCLLFAVTVAVLFGFMGHRRGWPSAWLAAGTLLLMPRVFAHAHLNATDVPAACFWLLATMAWLRGGGGWRDGLAAGIVCGLGLATKATFALLPFLFLAWIVLFRRWAWWRAGLLFCLCAPAVMLLLCPMWWHGPLVRPVEYFRTVFGSEEVWKIEVYYLGQTYIAGLRPLPWHNGWVLVALTTPVWVLLLAASGAVRAVRDRDAGIGLWAMGALLLPALRMLPGTPGHDGVRLMMPSLFCLAPLAGIGGQAVLELVRRPGAAHRRVVEACLTALVLAWGAWSLFRLHPFEMSYYNALVGGLRGAERRGFEVSYWFEALTPDALRAIQDHLPPGTRVWTFPRYEGYPLLRRWGMWRDDLVDGDIGDADYLILYSRKSRFYSIPDVAQIYARGRPIWSLEADGAQIIGLYKLAPKR